jgi:hypothetical protein
MTSNQAQFKSIPEAEASDWGIIAAYMKEFIAELPQRIITRMELPGATTVIRLIASSTVGRPPPAPYAMVATRNISCVQ